MEKDKILHTCSFCGKKYTEKEVEEGNKIIVVSPLFDGSSTPAKICEECIDACVNNINIIKKDEQITMPEVEKAIIQTPNSIKIGIDQWIIDQESAKKHIARAVFNHMKVIKANKAKGKYTGYEEDLDKTNILLVGPTGSGKTAIVKALSKQLDVPYVIADANSLTASGFVGRDVEDMLKDLYEASGKNLDKAQQGIIYIDEIDKLRRKGKTASGQKDVGGESVQQSLLKLVEGGTFEVQLGSKRNPMMSKTIQFDTSNVLFLGGGAFEGIETIIKERLDKKAGATKVGFSTKTLINEKSTNDYNYLIKQITPMDLSNFGMIPELLGRFPVIAHLEELSINAMINILTKPKNALVKQYTALFEMDDIKIEFDDNALEAIAKEAIKRKTGARALKSIMEETLSEVMYYAPEMSDLLAVKITKETVKDPSCAKYLFVGKEYQNINELNLGGLE